MTEDAKTYQHELTVTPGLVPTVVTMPDVHLCHYITDEQLDMLSMLEDEPAREACLLAIGVVAGSLVPAIIGVFRFSENKMQAVDMLQIILLAFACAVAVVTGWAWRRRAKTRPKLVRDIRNRPKVPVRISNERSA